MAYVYRHIRLDKNEPFYIGIGTDKTYKRANEKARRSEFWKKIVSKTKYEIEIIYDDIDFELAKIKEKEFIKLYGRKNLGTGTLVNMTDGGDGTKGKIITDEYRRKLSEAAKGKIIPQWQRDKISNSHIGHKWTQEQKDNLKKIRSNKKRIATKKQIEFAKWNMTVNNPSRNKTGVNSINFKGYVLAYKINGDFMGKYEGVNDAARKLNIDATKISAVLYNRRNHTKGYTFKRIKE